MLKFVVDKKIICVIFIVFILVAFFVYSDYIQEGLFVDTNARFNSYKDLYNQVNQNYADLDKTLPEYKQDMYGISGNSVSSKNTLTSGNSIINSSQTKYKSDISQLMDIEYHASDVDIAKNDATGQNLTWIFDSSGNIIPLPKLPIQGDIVYYTPGSYPFGTSNYVPNYEDSVYLSRLTGLSYTSPVYPTSSMKGGFCSNLKNSPEQLEQACIKQNSQTCGSTNCCVLLGGSKCVAGNELGPTNKANYGDIYIRNRDYYYYQGKCYGN
jgi:uncharacterized protein YxeA